MLLMLWKGIFLGLGAAVPIGPVNVEIARRALRHGFRGGFFVGCGAVTVDMCYAVLASFSVRPFLDRPRILVALGIAGSLLLAYLGVNCLIGAFRAPAHRLEEGNPGAKAHWGYVTGLLMTSLNPMTLAFWFVVVPGVAGQLSGSPRRDLPLICGGVFLGAFSWVCFFSFLMGSVRRAAGGMGGMRMADGAGGVMLLGFAAYAAYHSLS